MIDKRFLPENRPAIPRIQPGKSGNRCQQVQRLIAKGKRANRLVASHLANCDECRRKYAP